MAGSKDVQMIYGKNDTLVNLCIALAIILLIVAIPLLIMPSKLDVMILGQDRLTTVGHSVVNTNSRDLSFYVLKDKETGQEIMCHDDNCWPTGRTLK